MLPEKPWKLEAIARLLLSVVVCMMAGSLLATGIHLAPGGSSFRWKFMAVATVAFAAFGGTVVLLRRRWTQENYLLRVILCLGCFYIGVTLALWAQTLAGVPSNSISISQMIVSLLSFQGAALLLVHAFLKEHEMNWAETFGFANRWPFAFLWGMVVGALFLKVGLLLQGLSAETMTRLPIPIKPEEQQSVQTLRLASSWLDRSVLGLGTIFLVPFAEETLFRGVLYPAIKGAGFPRLSVWVTSFFFAIIHFNLATFVPLFILALLLTFLYEHTGNLLAPITAHAVFNALNFATLYLPQSKP
jgi:membrane protease YdiL (CAAX protease family)